jgi:hypothetical protein
MNTPKLLLGMIEPAVIEAGNLAPRPVAPIVNVIQFAEQSMAMREVLNKEPWWAAPPAPGQDESELEWGWLVIYSEGEPRFEFVKQRPSDREISNRKSCRITPQSD